jgi:hypothetical protein
MAHEFDIPPRLFTARLSELCPWSLWPLWVIPFLLGVAMASSLLFVYFFLAGGLIGDVVNFPAMPCAWRRWTPRLVGNRYSASQSGHFSMGLMAAVSDNRFPPFRGVNLLGVLRVVFTVGYLLALALGGWMVWRLTAGWPDRARAVCVAAFVLGFVQMQMHRWVSRGGTARPSDNRKNG